MKLYYTVASQPEAVQNKTNLSLGGYKSSSPVSNSSFGNMFSDISMYTVKNDNSNKYIGLVLKNETGVAVENVKLWFTYPEDVVSKLRVSAIDMTLDSESYQVMEHVVDNTSKPLYAEFIEADGETHKVDLGAFAIGEQIGIWFERELMLEAIKTQQNEIFQKDPNDPYRYTEIELSKEDNIGINFSWDVTVIP